MGVIDLVFVAVSYIRNAELALMLKRGAHMLAFILKCEASLARVYVKMRP